jgi:dihydropteroate synthase
VRAEDEIARVAPVISGLADLGVPLSIDTRKAAVARAALDAGARLVNDVSALTFDKALASFVAERGVPVCLMHAQGTPETMQADPRYDDVVLDVFEALADRIAVAEAAGIPRDRIVVDPGIGFGKTRDHNLALLRHVAVFHALGCPILVGASRKRFIGDVAGVPMAADRVPGSVAAALAAVSQGVQILRVHDTAETRQALSVHMAMIHSASEA